MKWGAYAPSRAANDALVVGIGRRGWNIRVRNHIRVRREGAPNRTRGACTPQPKLERFVKFKPQTPLREIIRLTAE